VNARGQQRPAAAGDWRQSFSQRGGRDLPMHLLMTRRCSAIFAFPRSKSAAQAVARKGLDESRPSASLIAADLPLFRV
jgi:hypothetical protein